MVGMLVGMISALTSGQMDKFVYNARSRDARNLANWWEDHQGKAMEVAKEDALKKEHDLLRRQAKAKLTEAELEALRGD